jgi:hypothetical protein
VVNIEWSASCSRASKEKSSLVEGYFATIINDFDAFVSLRSLVNQLYFNASLTFSSGPSQGTNATDNPSTTPNNTPTVLWGTADFNMGVAAPLFNANINVVRVASEVIDNVANKL